MATCQTKREKGNAMNSYRVFYKAARYLSETIVRAESREQAARMVMLGGYGAVAITGVIGPRKQ